MSDSYQFDGYKSHGREPLKEFVSDTIEEKQTDGADGYTYTRFGTDRDRLKLKQINADIQDLAKRFNELCEAAENAKQYGYNDNDYSIHGNYYNSQASKTINKINQINQESEN